MAGIWGEPHDPIGAGIQSYADLIAARLNKSKAEEQEQKNPYVGQRELEALLMDRLKNKWYEPNIRSEIGSRGAQANLANEEATTSRYKRDNGLLYPTEMQILKAAYGGTIPTGVIQAITQQRMQQPEQENNRSQTVNPISQAIQQMQPSYPDMTMQQQPQQQGGSLDVVLGNKLREMMMNKQKPSSQFDENKMTMIGQPNTILSNNVNQAMQQPVQQEPQQQFIQGTNIPSTGKGGLADAMVLHALGMSPESAGNAEYKKVMTEVAEKNLKAGNFDKMPAAQKQYAINQAMGFGLSNTDATKRFRNGDTIEDIAKEKGFDVNKPQEWPTPLAPPTTSMLTQQQRANVANAALNVIDPVIGEALAPYATRWNGKSLDMLKDAVKGENVDQQAKAIAAGALSMEVAALRLRAGGSPAGITALNEMVEKSQNKLDVIGPSLTPEVYKKAQKEITKMINVINNAENKAAWNQTQKSFDEEDKQQNSSENNSSDPMGLL